MEYPKSYKERVTQLPGQRFCTNNSGEIEILEYRGANNILVRFIDSRDEKITNWRVIKSGMVRNRLLFKMKERQFYGNAFIGEGIYNYKEDKQAFSIWTGILKRCYDVKIHKKHPSYLKCSVCNEWLDFQKFAEWYYKNRVDGYDIDKDILVKKNKVYSPETCVFAPKRINTLFIKRNLNKGNHNLPAGVYERYRKGMVFYVVLCNDENKRQRYIGSYLSVYEAFAAYKEAKECVIKHVAEEYKNRISPNLYQAMLNYKVEMDD